MSNWMKTALYLTLTAGCLAGMSGCGGSQASTVSGQVTLDGVALERGAVVFHPEEGGPVAYGSIDASGNYTVQTGDQHGLAPGEYAVTVVSTTIPPPATRDNPEPVGELITPPRYRDRQTSGLLFTVLPGENTIHLELSADHGP